MIQITKETTKDGKVWYDVQLVDNLPFITRLTEDQLTELHMKICEHLFENLLEQNKDMLQRLKNNESAPKWIKADDVVEWLVENFVDKFKEDFEL